MHTSYAGWLNKEDCKLSSVSRTGDLNTVAAHHLMNREVDTHINKIKEALISEYLRLHSHFACQMKTRGWHNGMIDVFI